jgi:hypothetical protein
MTRVELNKRIKELQNIELTQRQLLSRMVSSSL